MVVIATVILLNFRCEISFVQVIESILVSFMSAISVMSIKQYSISFVVGTNELHCLVCPERRLQAQRTSNFGQKQGGVSRDLQAQSLSVITLFLSNYNARSRFNT